MARQSAAQIAHGGCRNCDVPTIHAHAHQSTRTLRPNQGRRSSLVDITAHSYRSATSSRPRVIEGSTLSCHQGEITLTQSGGNTELHWSIRFRPKVTGTGALLQIVLHARLRTMLDDHLKPYIENSTAASVSATPQSANTETAVR